MSSESTSDDETTERPPTKATVQPATPWPDFSVDHARLELLIQRMLCSGLSERQVWNRVRRRVNRDELRRIAKVVAEEGASPQRPRDVMREQRRPARIRVRTPSAPPAAPEQPPLSRTQWIAAQAELSVRRARENERSSHDPGDRTDLLQPQELAEPEQLTLVQL